MKLYRAKDYKEMSRKAANIISAQIIMKPNCVLGLATGATPIGIYQQLIEWYRKGDLDFSEVVTVNLDEYRGLPRSSEQSYYYFMRQNLFDHINIRPENTHIPNGMEKDSDKACRDYSNIIHQVGLGHNGHIGFNEPDDAFEKEVHCVNLAECTIKANARFFTSIEQVPTQAYTMGIKTIMQAKKIVVVVSGTDKANILKEAFYGPVTPHVPASILQMHNDVIIVADQDASSQLL